MHLCGNVLLLVALTLIFAFLRVFFILKPMVRKCDGRRISIICFYTKGYISLLVIFAGFYMEPFYLFVNFVAKNCILSRLNVSPIRG